MTAYGVEADDGTVTWSERALGAACVGAQNLVCYCPARQLLLLVGTPGKDELGRRQ